MTSRETTRRSDPGDEYRSQESLREMRDFEIGQLRSVEPEG